MKELKRSIYDIPPPNSGFNTVYKPKKIGWFDKLLERLEKVVGFLKKIKEWVDNVKHPRK